MSTEAMCDSSFDPDDPDSSDSELDDEPYNGGQAFAVADDPGKWLTVAVDHMENGKVDRAQECFENATKYAPDGANGLSKAFDTSIEFERYLHALLCSAVYGGQEVQDDLIDTCRNLCVNSGRWPCDTLIAGVAKTTHAVRDIAHHCHPLGINGPTPPSKSPQTTVTWLL